MRIVSDVGVEKFRITNQIKDLQSRQKHHFFDFDIQFSNRSDANVIEKYFTDIGYQVSLKWCGQCQNNMLSEIIIQF